MVVGRGGGGLWQGDYRFSGIFHIVTSRLARFLRSVESENFLFRNLGIDYLYLLSSTSVVLSAPSVETQHLIHAMIGLFARF